MVSCVHVYVRVKRKGKSIFSKLKYQGIQQHYLGGLLTEDNMIQKDPSLTHTFSLSNGTHQQCTSLIRKAAVGAEEAIVPHVTRLQYKLTLPY